MAHGPCCVSARCAGRCIMISNVVRAFFRRRGEGVLAVQNVVQINADEGKNPKPRVVAVAAPLLDKSAQQAAFDDGGALDLSAAVLYILSKADTGLTIKHTLPVQQLSKESPVHIQHTDAKYEIGDSVSDDDTTAGTVRLSFESAIQRDLVAAAIKRARRALDEEQYGGDAGISKSFSGPVSIEGGGASYGKSIRKKREDTRSGVLQPEDEVYLTDEASRLKIPLHDMPSFEHQLRGNGALSDVEAVNLIVASGDLWARHAEVLTNLQDDVVRFEAKVNEYSFELLSRKEVIQEIEQISTLKQRVKTNLTALIREVNQYLECFDIDARTEAQLEALAGEDSAVALEAFFTDSRRVRELNNAVRIMNTVIDTPPAPVVTYASLNATSTRVETFRALQLAIGEKVSKWVEAVSRRYGRALLEVPTRRSTPQRLVLLPPVELMDQIFPFSDLMACLREVDFRRHVNCVRVVSSQLRSLYTIEIRRFFKELRGATKRVGWKGSLTIGDTSVAAGASAVRRLAAQGDLTPVGVLTPSTKTGDAEDSRSNGSDVDGNRKNAAIPALVELWRDNEAGVRLLKPTSRYMPRSATVRKRDIAAGVASTGYMRPDLAWAAALKASSDVVFVQRNFFIRALGLRSRKRVWQIKVELARARGSAESVEDIIASSTAQDPDDVIFSPDDDDGYEIDEENPLDELQVGKNDELNTALWECFTTNLDTLPSQPTLVEIELLHTARVVAQKCDGIYLLICLACNEKMLRAIDDGDHVSSARLCAMERLFTQVDTAPQVNRDESKTKAFIDQRSGFFTGILVKCNNIMRQALQLYVVEQYQAAERSAAESAGKPSLMTTFLTLPVILSRIETMLSDFVDLPMMRIESFIKDLVQFLFEQLDNITLRPAKNSLNALHYTVFKQYLHHAFFAAVVQTTLVSRELKAVLADFLSRSSARRDHFEKEYIVDVLFPDAFPRLHRFMQVADDARRMFDSNAELACHTALKETRVAAVVMDVGEELPKGIAEVAKRLKLHFSRAVPIGDPAEDAFFRAALPVAFDRVKKLVASRVASLRELVEDINYHHLLSRIPSSAEVTALFDEVATSMR